VTFVYDEARKHLAREKEGVSTSSVVTFIDTFAATAAGAYALTENSLYTVEGWDVFLERAGGRRPARRARAVSPELGRLSRSGAPPSSGRERRTRSSTWC